MPYMFSGFPRREKIACVKTSLLETMAPVAESPSVIKIMVSSPNFPSPKWNLQSFNFGIFMAIFFAAAFASFFTVLSSVRSFSLAIILLSSFAAESAFFCSHSTTADFVSLTIQERTSVLPSLFFVWLSNTGAWIFTETAAQVPSLTSSLL